MDLIKKQSVMRNVNFFVLSAAMVTLAWLLSADRAVATPAILKVPVGISFPTDQKRLDESLLKLASRFLLGEGGSALLLDQKLGDVTIRDPFEVQLKGVRLRSRVTSRIETDAKGLVLEAKLLESEVVIDSITIHTTTTIVVGGVTANIRIDADCSATSITWPGLELGVFARGQFRAQNGLSVEISELLVPPPEMKPEIKTSCTGPAGIESELRGQVWVGLASRWSEPDFQKSMRTEVQNSLNEKIALLTGKGMVLVPGGDPESLRMTLVQERWVSGVSVNHMIGHVRVEGTAVMMPQGLWRDDLLPKQVAQIQLTAPIKGLEAIMDAMLAPGFWSFQSDAQKVSGFRDLMSSRFKQLIAFPDLMRYDKWAPFWFSTGMTAAPKLACDNASGGKAVALDLPIGTWLTIKSDELRYVTGFKPLVHFDMPTKAILSLPRAASGVRSSLRVDDVGFTSRFEPGYVDREDPNTSIADETIQSSVEDEAKSTVLQDLPGDLGTMVKALDGFDLSCNPATDTMTVILGQ